MISDPLGLTALGLGTAAGLAIVTRSTTLGTVAKAESNINGSRPTAQLVSHARSRVGFEPQQQSAIPITVGSTAPGGEMTAATSHTHHASSDWLTLIKSPSPSVAPSTRGLATAGASANGSQASGSMLGGGAAGGSQPHGTISALQLPPPQVDTQPNAALSAALGFPTPQPTNPSTAPVTIRSSTTISSGKAPVASMANAPQQPAANPGHASVSTNPSGGVSGPGPFIVQADPTLYVLDMNNGVLNFENSDELATLGGTVDLIAQMHLGNNQTLNGFSWDTSQLAHGTVIGGTGPELIIQWANSNSTPAIDTVTVTGSAQGTGGGTFYITHTCSFYVPAGSAPGNNPPVPSWPNVVLPETNLPLPFSPASDPVSPFSETGGAVNPTPLYAGPLGVASAGDRLISTHNAAIEVDSGALDTTLTLPSYSPNVPSLTLAYNSITAHPMPIFLAHYPVPITPPDVVGSQFFFNHPLNTPPEYYINVNLNGFGGEASGNSTLQTGMQVDTSTYPTGDYSYSWQIAYVYGVNTPTVSYTTLTFSGEVMLENESTNPIGAGWSLYGLGHLYSMGGSGYSLNFGGGSNLFFSGGGSTFTSPAGDFSTLVRNPDSTFTRTLKDGTKEYFDSNGRETTIVDLNGLTYRYSYDVNGRLQTIYDPYGKQTLFSYDGNGLLSSIQDPANRITTFTHSGTNLTAATLPDNSTWHYGYAGNAQLTQVTDSNSQALTVTYDNFGRVSGTVRPDGTTEAFQIYQEQGILDPLTRSTDPLNPSPMKLLAESFTQYTDPLGRVTKYYPDWYGMGLTNQPVDPDGGVTTTDRDANGLATVTIDRLNRITTWTYDSKGNVTKVVYPDTSTEQFAYNSFSEITTYTDERGNVTTNTYDPYGNLTLVQDPLNNRTTMVYTIDGMLSTYQDPRGNVTSYYYDSQDRLTTLTFPGVVSQYFSYNSSGNLTSLTDERGKLTTFSYDPMNRLTGITDALSHRVTATYDPVGNLTVFQDQLGRRTTLAYDSMNRVTMVTDALSHQTTFQYDSGGRLTTVTDPLGRVTTYAYDDNDRVTTIIDALGHNLLTSYDAEDQVTSVMDQNNRITTYTYTPRGWLATVTDPTLATTTYSYDSGGNLTAVTDPNGRTVTHAYDADNRLTTITDPLSHSTVLGYDGASNLISSKDANGNTTTLAYDSRNRLTTITDALSHSTVFGYDPASNRTTVTDPLGRTTTFAYDAVNRLTTITDPLSHTTVLGYDAVGNLLTQTDPLSRTTTFAYDAINRLTTITDPLGHNTTLGYDSTGNLTGITDADGKRTTYGYDALNRLTSVTDPLHDITTYTYDDFSNLTAVTDPNGNTSNYTYDGANRLTIFTDGLGHATTYTRDSGGYVRTITDANLNTTTISYDAAYRTTTITDGKGDNTVMAYDSGGRLVSVTDPNGNRTTYGYDAANRVTTITDPLSHSTTFLYDAANQLVDTTDRDGRRVTYAYDSGGRETNEYWLTSSGGTLRTITYTYDAANQLTGVLDPDATLTFTYDSGGRTTAAATSGPAGQPLVTLSYGSDNTSHRTSLADSLAPASRGLTTYTYNDAHRLANIAQSNGGTTGPNVAIVYDSGGRMTSMTRTIGGSGTAINTTISYDGADRITGIRHWSGGGRFQINLGAYVYTYDAGNRLTGESNPDGGYGYSYDKANQVTTITYPDTSVGTYTYDSGGNRTMTGYSTGQANELNSAPGYTYTYDNEGNLTSERNTSTGATTTFAYDYHNRLTGATVRNSGGVITGQATYTYDPLDRRIGRDENGTQSWTVYDGLNPYADFNATGGLQTRYLFGPAVDQILARTSSSGTTTWYLTDRLGTVHDIADLTPTSIYHVVYDPFGNIQSESGGTNGDRFKYAGMEHDAVIGMYYDRAREYNPLTGRFLSQDPLGFGGGDANLYRYVGNGPTNWTDPSGMRYALGEGSDQSHQEGGGSTGDGGQPGDGGEKRVPWNGIPGPNHYGPKPPEEKRRILLPTFVRILREKPQYVYLYTLYSTFMLDDGSTAPAGGLGGTKEAALLILTAMQGPQLPASSVSGDHVRHIPIIIYYNQKLAPGTFNRLVVEGMLNSSLSASGVKSRIYLMPTDKTPDDLANGWFSGPDIGHLGYNYDYPSWSWTKSKWWYLNPAEWVAGPLQWVTNRATRYMTSYYHYVLFKPGPGQAAYTNRGAPITEVNLIGIQETADLQNKQGLDWNVFWHNTLLHEVLWHGLLSDSDADYFGTPTQFSSTVPDFLNPHTLTPGEAQRVNDATSN